MLGNTPLIVKIGYLPEPDLRDFVTTNAKFINGIVAINAISTSVVRHDGSQTFPNALPNVSRKTAGISGWAIRSRAHEVAKNLVALRKDVLKEHHKELTLLSIGGVLTKQDFADRLAVGVDGVETCTGAYLNPYLGLAIRASEDVESLRYLLNVQKDQAVLAALSDPRYSWRTVPGIARETGLSVGEVMSILARLGEENKVVKSDATSPEGLELFASRRTIREKGSLAERILSVIKNRAP